jgi:MFS family permease
VNCDPVRHRDWLVLAAISLIFMLQNAATFGSLGVVLPAMMRTLHWSYAQAGLSFSLLGLACGLSSPLAAFLMRRSSCRVTIALGGVALAAGFIGTAAAPNLNGFYGLMVLAGIGITLVANIPGIQLIVNWFARQRTFAIGAYLLIGASGGVIGPEIASAVVDPEGDWQNYWALMAAAILLSTALCLIVVRDHPPEGLPAEPETATDRGAEDWTYRDAVRTPQYIILAAVMTGIILVTFTVNSAMVSHLVRRGFTAGAGAHALALQALLAMLAKGLGGVIGERVEPKTLLIVGLLAAAGGFAFLAFVGGTWMIYAFAAAFGLGWGISYFAVTMLVVNYFGRRENGALFATIWLATTLATFGPVAGGVIADYFGSFSPLFLFYIGVLIVAAIVVATMRPPRKPVSVA